MTLMDFYVFQVTLKKQGMACPLLFVSPISLICLFFSVQEAGDDADENPHPHQSGNGEYRSHLSRITKHDNPLVSIDKGTHIVHYQLTKSRTIQSRYDDNQVIIIIEEQ